MDQAMEHNVVTEKPETAPVSSEEEVVEVMDLGTEDNFDSENPETVLESGGIIEIVDQAVDSNFMTENLETAPGVTEVMDTNENIVGGVHGVSPNNKIGNTKSKIQKNKIMKMTVAPVAESKNRKRKAAHPPTSEMVIDSIKALKKRNGASFEDIRKYMEEKYVVNMKYFKRHVEKFLQKGIGNGALEKIDRGRSEGRFKIKKSENIKKDSKNVPQKEEKMKSKKKMAASKNQVKK